MKILAGRSRTAGGNKRRRSTQEGWPRKQPQSPRVDPNIDVAKVHGR